MARVRVGEADDSDERVQLQPLNERAVGRLQQRRGKLVGELRGSGWERFSVAQFKDRFALSRKWAIPLLEHLDSTGVTRRAGDDRLLEAPKSGA